MSARSASRYAKSLLELARDKGKLDEVHQDMLLFNKVCDENFAFVLMLRNPIINHPKKRAVLHGLFKSKTDPLTMAILDITTRKNREKLLPVIAKEFHYQYNIERGIQEASITTTFELDDSLRKKFNEIIIEISKAKTLSLEEKIDENIIGGFLLKVGDKQVDESISNKLKQLRLKLS